MKVMMQCQCPACGRASRIPVDEAVQCCWCGRWLNASAGRKAAPFAEPERPKVRLEKELRVNLKKDLPAASAALPQRVPKSQPVIPQQTYCRPPEIDPEWILHEQKKRIFHYVLDAAVVLGFFLMCFMSAFESGEWDGGILVALLGILALPYAVISAAIRYEKQQILGRKQNITVTVTLVWFFLQVVLTILGIWGGSILGATLY